MHMPHGVFCVLCAVYGAGARSGQRSSHFLKGNSRKFAKDHGNGWKPFSRKSRKFKVFGAYLETDSQG